MHLLVHKNHATGGPAYVVARGYVLCETQVCLVSLSWCDPVIRMSLSE